MSKHLYIMVDVETDGPCPADYSMVRFGAIVVEPALDRTFDGLLCPVSEQWQPEALAISGFTREETLGFPPPLQTMLAFETWLAEIRCRRPLAAGDVHLRFIADNNGFDWAFINWYCWHFLGRNPFGFSSTNLGSLFKGIQRNLRASFKHLRKTKHDHNPVNDAKGNAEAMLTMMDKWLR